MNFKFNRAAAMAMSVVTATTMITPALADPASGDGQSVPVELTVEKPTFSVTVPTGLPIAVDADGKVYCSTNATIKNNTHGQVKVAGVTIEGNEPWSVASWDTDMQKEKVNTSKIAMQLNNGVTGSDGYQFSQENFPVMDGHGSMPLTYDAKLPAQTKVIPGNTVANVTFTVGWNTDGSAGTVTPTVPESKPLQGIQMNKPTTTINMGSTETLSVIYNPDETTDSKDVEWSVIDGSAVKVDNGVVTPLEPGQATVQAKVGSHKATCVVTVPTPAHVEKPHSTDAPLDKDMMYDKLANLTGAITFSREKAPTDGTVPLNKDGSVVAKIVGQDATVYSKNGGGVAAPENCSYLFQRKQSYADRPPVITPFSAKIFNFDGLDTSNVTDMSYMFQRSAATSLNLGNFDTSNVTDMDSMFAGSKATTLDLSSFDTSKVTTMDSMFAGSKATTLDLSSFDTSKVTNMEYMFGYSKATSMDLSSFDTSKVTNMELMFCNSAVTTLDLSSFDTSSVKTMRCMFENAAVTSLDLSSFDMSSVTNMLGMFDSSAVKKVYCRTEQDMKKMKLSDDCRATGFVVGKP